MSLFKFEWKKLHQSKLPYFLLFVTLLLITLLFVRNDWVQDQLVQQEIERFSRVASDLRMEMEMDRKTLETVSDPGLEEKVAMGSTLYQRISEHNDNLRSSKKMEALQTEVSIYDLASVYKSKEGTFMISEQDMEYEKALNKVLMELKMPKEPMNQSILPALFLTQVLNYLLSGWGILIILLVTMAFITREYEERTIRLSHTLPVVRSHYLLTKLVVLVTIGLVWMGISGTYAYALASLVTDAPEQQFAYPLLLHGEEWFSAGEKLKGVATIGVIGVIAVLSIGWAVATSIRSTIVSYIGVLLLVGGGTFWALKSELSFWNPAQLFDISNRLNGAQASLDSLLITALLISLGSVWFTLYGNTKRSV